MAMVGDDLGNQIDAARKAAIESVPAVQTSDLAEAIAYGDAIRLADSLAIGRTVVSYIQQHARATGNDSNADTHDLPIS